jgi:predicted nuclease of predicted toxin-antitoxin system
MLRFLLDEHLRGPLWSAIQRHNLQGGLPIDAVRVGDPPDLPLSSDDMQILEWAEREDRIVITEDKHTMPAHLTARLRVGHQSPGILMIRGGCSLSQLVRILELVAHAGQPADYKNGVTYVP